MDAAVTAPEPPARDEAPTAWADDAEAMAAVARGQERAFTLLYSAHHPAVVRVAVGILDDAAQARDVAQECFVKLWQVAPGWEPRARVRTWLYRVAVNECLSWRRALTRRVGMIERAAREPVASTSDAHAAIEKRVARSRMRAALAALAPRDRALVVLHVDQELAPAEIGALFGMTDNGARVALFRAMERLTKAAGDTR